MSIKRFSNAGRTVYQLLSGDGSWIASYATLADAAIVLRYVNGGELTAGEHKRAAGLMTGGEQDDA